MQLPFGREIDFHSANHIRREKNSSSSLQSPLQKTSVGERGRKERSTRLLLVMMMETASQTLVTMVTLEIVLKREEKSSMTVGAFSAEGVRFVIICQLNLSKKR